MEITCKRCGAINRFEQPYVYHAGFADWCFLYNDAGNLTLTWSVVDPDFEAIVGPRGFTPAQAGVAGGVMLVAGIVGAVALPLLSDARRRRKPFVIIALAGLLPGLVGLTFATSYWLLLASSAFFGSASILLRGCVDRLPDWDAGCNLEYGSN